MENQFAIVIHSQDQIFALHMFLLSLCGVYSGVYATYIPSTKSGVNMNKQKYCARHVPVYEPHAKSRNICGSHKRLWLCTMKTLPKYSPHTHRYSSAVRMHRSFTLIGHVMYSDQPAGLNSTILCFKTNRCFEYIFGSVSIEMICGDQSPMNLR